MDVLPINTTRELKRSIVSDGLVALAFGHESFYDWARNYSPDDGIVARDEFEFVDKFYKYMRVAIKEGFRAFDPYQFSPGVDDLVRQIDSK